MKRSLSILLSAVLLITMLAGMVIPASADATADGLLYTVSGGEASVTGYTGTATELTIPDALGGAPVTTIAVNAFEDNQTLTAVVLPDTVRLIDECAFANCPALTRLAFGSTVTTIGFSAFYGCDALTTVDFDGSQARWNAIEIGAYNEPLTSASILFTVRSGGSLMPESADDFLTLTGGGGTMEVLKLANGFSFDCDTSNGWPCAYTRRDSSEYITVDRTEDVYLNFNFVSRGGKTNIVIAFGGCDINNDVTLGHWVSLNGIIKPSYVDANGIVTDLEAGTYTGSVHVSDLCPAEELVTNNTFEISDIKIYAVGGTTVVRDISVGEALYDVIDLPDKINPDSVERVSTQSLLPASANDFIIDESTGPLWITALEQGYEFYSYMGYPWGYTQKDRADYITVDVNDPNVYLYYDFEVFFGATNIRVYFSGADPLSDAVNASISVNGLVDPSYVDASGVVTDLPAGKYRGCVRIGDIGYSPSLVKDGKLALSDVKIFAVAGMINVNELSVVTAKATQTTTSSTTTTTTTTTKKPVTFSLSTQKAQVGDTITVDVTVSDNHYLSNGQLLVEYDPAALKMTASVSNVNAALIGDNTFWSFGTPSNGAAKFVFANPNVSGSAVGGTLFTLTFEVLEGIGEETTLSLTSPEMCSAKDGRDYNTDAVYVNGVVCNADTLLLGDVNSDGKVDLTDATRVFYHVNGLVTLTGKELLAADYTANGAVDLDDATRLFYFVNGLLG